MNDQQIRDHIDSLAPPLSLDEVTDAGAVTRVVPMNSRHRAQVLAIAAVLIAALTLAGLAVLASRDTGSVAPVAAQPVGLTLTPANPEIGTSFVATLTGDNLDELSLQREAYIEKMVGDGWQRIWLVYPVFVDATASPPEPVDLTVDSAPPGISALRLVATLPLRIVLPRQVDVGTYRVCLQADLAPSTTDGGYCAPIVVRDPVSTDTSVQPVDSVPSEVGSASIGTEVPLVEVAVTEVQNVAKPGSAHAFSVEGHPPVVLWTTLMPNIQTTDVEEWRCVSEAFGSGCGSTSMPAQFGQTSSIDNHVASDDLFTWSNLPAEVDTVRYDDGVTQLWQHPVAGLAIFRVDPNHSHPNITAYNAAGAVLQYSFWGQNPPLTPNTGATDNAATAVPTNIGEIVGELEGLTQSSTHDCLTANGASWAVANVPTFAGGADPLSIWNSCVAQVRTIVAARKAELTKGS